MAATTAADPIVDDPDAPGPPISVPDSGDTGEGGKLKMIISLLKRALGVKDIAAMRLSLPASLLEPIPNLEYWNYLDRPDLFAGYASIDKSAMACQSLTSPDRINDSDDSFERFLAVLRFMFSKDLKFIVRHPPFHPKLPLM
jgi:oxysterol-binding protein-related protein 9/10/11